MLQTGKESKNSSFIKLLLQMWQSVAFLYFSQSSAVISIGFGAATLSYFHLFQQNVTLKRYNRVFTPVNI